MGCRWAPVEAAGDHRAVVDHGDLVVKFVAPGQARGGHPLQGGGQGLVAGLQLAVAIRQGQAEQVEHFRKGAIGKARVGQQPDLDALGLELAHGVCQILGRKDKQGQVQAAFAAREHLGQQVQSVLGILAAVGRK